MEVLINRRSGLGSSFVVYTFVPDSATFVGAPCVFMQDGTNWELKIFTSGTLTFNRNLAVDLFAVGGGGGGGAKVGGGGGGGYTATARNQYIPAEIGLTVTVGVGGAGSAANSTARASTGGASYVTLSGDVLVTANGGQGGDSGNGSANGRRGGGAGGSGGGGGSYGDNKIGGTGGTDGGNGTKGTYSSGNSAKAGTGGRGQGTTTRAFGESTGEIYSGGGGASGGGNAGDATGCDANLSSKETRFALPNRGGGGGGGYSTGPGAPGASGIVIIRNARGS